MWDFDGGTDTPSGSTHMVSWPDIGTKTVSLVVEENTCVSDTTRKDISVNPVPISEFIMPAAVCDSDQVDIVYSGVDSVNAGYNWNFDGGTAVGSDEGPYQVLWTTDGTKSVSLQVTQDGCQSPLTQKDIDVKFTYAGTEICLITVDSSTQKHMVIWEKPLNKGIESFNVYRQTSIAGEYELLSNVPYDNLSVYVDITSEPKKKQYLYKISAVDSCGESPKSPYHKTLLLQFDADDGDLHWGKYEIENGDIGFSTILIYEGADSVDLTQIASVAGNEDFYSDLDPPDPTKGKRWYRIAGVKPDTCYPSVSTGGLKAGTGPYVHSLSNLDDNKLKTSTKDVLTGTENLRVYPNPFQDEVRVEYLIAKPSAVKIEVYNILGVRVLELENNTQLPGVYHYDIRAEDLDGSSIYYLRFSIDDRSLVRKLIPAR
jgi:hypothetical protein